MQFRSSELKTIMTDFFKLHAQHFNLKTFVKIALAEDVGNGDHTTIATLKPGARGKMKLLVKEDGVLAGVGAAKAIIREFDRTIKFKPLLSDGTQVKKGDIAFYLEGETLKLLTIERLVLNVMQRMSGIATHTRHLQEKCAGTKARVIDTRKTTPGFRFFEKWAVVIGGGANHRYGLFDMILIKDNHIDFAGGINEAIESVQHYLKRKKLKLKIEVEARTINDVRQILNHSGIERILLDNFTPRQTKIAVELIKGKIKTESSGGIQAKNIRNYALAGVDFISVGALTHQVNSLDLSLKAI